ncbi:MAG: PQQ-binding-like beta-propeller repeat protein [Bradymonadia bacterium]
MNGPKYASPPTKFKPGHVTPASLPKETLERSKTGFTLKLPSGAPVVTPAVYEDLVITGGGFRSKTLYAFHARTGEMVWGLNLDDDGPSSPACADGICVVNTESCTVFAVEARTGKLLWSWWMGDPMLSAPAIADGKVYTVYPARGHGGGYGQAIQNNSFVAPGRVVRGGAADGKGPHPKASHVLAALDLKSGGILWQRWIDSDVIAAPVVDDGEVLATSFAGTLYRFAPATGEILGAERVRATTTPTLHQGKLLYSRRTDGDGQSAREGLVQWDRGRGQADYTANEKQAPYLDSKVQSSSRMWNAGKSLDAANGFSAGAPATANPQLALGNVGQGSVSTLQSFQGSRVLPTDHGNVSAMGDEVVCTDHASGKTLWRHSLKGDLAKEGGALAAPPIHVGGKLLVATLAGTIQVLDPQTGALVKSHRLGAPLRAQPVVADGWIYAGTADGRLVAVNTGDQTMTGWPMWGQNAARQGRGR